MKNKIKGKIIQTTKRLTVGIVRRLLNMATTVVKNNRAKRPIHLHSSAAIRIWLAMVDRPLARYNGTKGATFIPANRPFRTIDSAASPSSVTPSPGQTGGGASGEESE